MLKKYVLSYCCNCSLVCNSNDAKKTLLSIVRGLTSFVIEGEEDQDIKDTSKDIDFSLGFGGGVSFPFGNNSFFVEGRYFLGLDNINDADSGAAIPVLLLIIGIVSVIRLAARPSKIIWDILIPVASLILYFIYESYIPSRVNIRIDLLLLYPLLFVIFILNGIHLLRSLNSESRQEASIAKDIRRIH